MSESPDVIGLIPAGGVASRLGRIPCSKEIFPLGHGADGNLRVTSEPLIQAFRAAGIEKAFFILREGKWDIPRYYGDGTRHGVNIGYLMMNRPFGVPFTLDQAYPFCARSLVALGFPDILFHPADAYARLKERMLERKADLALGLWPIRHPHTWDMVETDAAGRVLRLSIKPEKTELKLGWTIAMWSPAFSRFLHEHLNEVLSRDPQGRCMDAAGGPRELCAGDVLQAAIDAELPTCSVIFDGECLDTGTPENLEAAMRQVQVPVR